MGDEVSSLNVDAVKWKETSMYGQRRDYSFRCCGKSHKPRECLAFYAKCRKCGEKIIKQMYAGLKWIKSKWTLSECSRTD